MSAVQKKSSEYGSLPVSANTADLLGCLLPHPPSLQVLCSNNVMSEPTILLWNCAGEEEEENPMPESFKRWVATDGGDLPEDENWRPIMHAVETSLSRKIAQMDSRSLSLNYVSRSVYSIEGGAQR